MMIKHLRDLLRAYLQEHAAAQVRQHKLKLLIYDEYLKEYVSAEELLIPGHKKIIASPVSLNGTNELLLYDFLLKKFINPKLDLQLPLEIKHEHEIHKLYPFNKTNKLNFNTSSTDYFWKRKKASKDKKHTSYPALPVIHDIPEEAGPVREGWAGQLTKPPPSNPRLEKNSSSCSVGPDKDPKKKPPKKKPNNLICGKNKKQEQEISAKEAQEEAKKFEFKEEDCQDSKDVKSTGSSLPPQIDDKHSSKSSKEQCKKDSKSVFEKLCSKLFSNGKGEDKTSKKEKFDVSSKSLGKLENDPCKLRTDFESKIAKKVEECNKITENLDKVDCKKDCSTFISKTSKDECNVCASTKESQKSAKSEFVAPKSKFSPKSKSKPCPCSLVSSETKSIKTKPDPCENISAKSVVQDKPGVCSESIGKTPCVDNKKLKPCTKSTIISAKQKTQNVNAKKGTICSEIKKSCVSASVDKIKKECKREIEQEIQSSSIQKNLQCKALTVDSSKLICNKENSTINKRYDFIVDPKVKKLRSPCSKNAYVSMEEVTRSKECKTCSFNTNSEPPKEQKTFLAKADVCDCKDKTSIIDQSSKNNEPCKTCVKNVCKNKKQSVKCPLSLSESTRKPCPKVNKDAELGLAKCPKTKAKESVSDNYNRICKTSMKPRGEKEVNIKRKSKSLSAFQCQHIEPKVTEKLQKISQKTSFNQINSNSDLSQLKCEKYMGFKIKRSTSEGNQLKENKNKTSESPCKKLKSTKTPCATVTQSSEIKMKKPKESKSNEANSKRKKTETKSTKSEQCLKSSKTSLEKSKSSTEKKPNLKQSKTYSSEIKEEKSDKCDESKTSQQSSKQTQAKICSQSSNVDEKNQVKKFNSKQNINKSKVIEDSCSSNISNTVESSQECTNKDFEKPSGQSDEDKLAEQIDNLSNQCCKTVDERESSSNQGITCRETVDKASKINDSECPEIESEERQTKCPPSKGQQIISSVENTCVVKDDLSGKQNLILKEEKFSPNEPCGENTTKEINLDTKTTKSKDKLARKNTLQKTSEQSQENLKKQTSKKIKRNKSAVICSFDKVSNSKNKQTTSKSKASRDSKKALLKTESSPNLTKAPIQGKKSKISNKRKDPKIHKSEISVNNATICSKPSKELKVSPKGKFSFSTAISQESKSKSIEDSNDSKEKLARSSSGRSKSSRMCSLQTLQKRVTEDAVKKSKTVEVKSFSETKSIKSNPETEKSVFKNRVILSRQYSDTKEKKMETFQDHNKDSSVVLFHNERKLDDSDVHSSISGIKAVPHSQQSEYWYNDNNTGSKFALIEDRHQHEYSKLLNSKIKQFQRNLSAPEDKVEQKANNRDSSIVKNIHTIKSNLPQIALKTRKAENVSVQNNNITQKISKQHEVSMVRNHHNDKPQSCDKGNSIRSVEPTKNWKNLIKDSSMFEKYNVTGKHSNQSLGLKDNIKRKVSVREPSLVRARNVVEDQPVCNNLKSNLYPGIKIQEKKTNLVTQKNDSVDKTVHKDQNNRKGDELNVKELFSRQKLAKLKVFNSTISKRFELRPSSGSHVVPIVMKSTAKENQGTNSLRSVEETKQNSSSLQKTITGATNTFNVDQNYSNVSKVQKSLKNKLQPSFSFPKSSNELLNKSFYNENKKYTESKINSKNETQHWDKSTILKTPDISIKNDQRPKPQKHKHKQNHIRDVNTVNNIEKMDNVEQNALQHKEVSNSIKQYLNRNKNCDLKSDNYSLKVNTNKNCSTANEIKKNLTTIINSNNNSLANSKTIMSSKPVNTTTNTFKNTVENVKVDKTFNGQNTLPKTTLQTRGKSGDIVDINYKNPSKLKHFNTNKNISLKSKTFIQETSNALVKSKRPNTVNINFTQTQKPLLEKNINSKNIEKQPTQAEIKKVEGNTQSSSKSKKMFVKSNSGIKLSLEHAKKVTIKRQKSFMLRPGKRLKKILKKDPSLKVKRTKTYLVFDKSDTNTFRDNMSLAGSTKSKTKKLVNDVKKYIKVEGARKRVNLTFKSHENISSSSENSLNHTNNRFLLDKTNENKMERPLMRKMAKMSLACSSSNERLKSSMINNDNSNINMSGNEMHISHAYSSDNINKKKTVNVLPSFKWNSSLPSPFKKSPAAKYHKE